jgi:pulcherriminic acid synthase
VSGPDIFCEAFARDPYPLYRVMRDEYPLYFHETAHAYILSRYDDVSHALSHADFTTRSYAAQIEPLLGVTIVQLDGRAHARQRRLLAPSFRGDQINAAFGQDIAALADRLIRLCRRRAGDRRWFAAIRSRPTASVVYRAVALWREPGR